MQFLYGDDTYRIIEKVRSAKDKFIQDEGGDFNLVEIDGRKLTKSRFETELATLPFLGDKRLILISNLFSENSDSDLKDLVAEKLKKQISGTEIILYEAGSFDKRNGAFKKLSKQEGSIKFDPLAGLELTNWISKKAKESSLEIESSANQKLQLLLGNDLWRLENEIKKLSSYAKSQNNPKITSKDVELLVVGQNSNNIFDLVDNIGNKNDRAALNLLHDFLNSGENENYLISMIVYQFRNMLVVSDLLQRKKNPETESGLHPFVVKKIRSSLKNYSFTELKKAYNKLVLLDYYAKTGRIDLKTGLDLLVVDFCKK